MSWTCPLYGDVDTEPSMHLDDIYIIKWQEGFYNNTFLGSCIVELSLPSSAKATGGDPGSVQQWTPSSGTNHEALVDDPNEHDGDTTYVTATAANLVELNSMVNLSAITGNILGVRQVAFARLTSVGSRNLRLKYKEPGGEVINAADVALTSTTYVPITLIREEVAAATPRVFSVNDINNGEFGFETRP